MAYPIRTGKYWCHTHLWYSRRNNSEIYQQLEESDFITPCLVTHEASAAYMADAISRTTNSIGTLMIVPASGITNAASGIGEAYLAGIPMLIITGGVDRAKKHY